MVPMDNSLPTKFLGCLYDIELKLKKHYYFEQSGLFWSINRMFSFYYRIVSVYNPKVAYHGNKDFLDADLESYIIRHRIILNDIGYILWQLLTLFGIDIGIKPKGPSHPRNNELRFFKLAKKIQANTDPRLDNLRTAAANGVAKFSPLKDQRDNIAHYKSAILIFGEGPDYEFAAMNPAGTMPTVSDGTTTKLVTKKVFDFTNEQQIFLWDWMNGELTDAIVDLCKNFGLALSPDGLGVQLKGGAAIALFKEINNLK